jgi:hypothetical protein
MANPQRRQHSAQSAHSRFVARVKRYCETAQLHDSAAEHWCFSDDAPVLDRLCVHSLPMQGFWGLAENLPDGEFNRLIMGIFSAARLAAGSLAARKVLEDDRHSVEKALALFRELRGTVTTLKAAGPVLMKHHDLLESLGSVGHLLTERHNLLGGLVRNIHISRKAKAAPYVLFIPFAVQTMSQQFGKKHFAIVAELANVLYSPLELVSPDAARRVWDRMLAASDSRAGP